MTERTTAPKHAICISSYQELGQFAQAFADGNLNLLILVGRAGTAKSQTLRSVVGDRVCWIESNATAYGIYGKLYEHKDDPVVIDDVDALYADKSAVRLLKCLCQTDPAKSVAWHTRAVGSDGIPREFVTRSRVCIIANDWKSLDANTAAVEDRGHLVFFEPTAKEVHLQVANWFWDQQVYNWFAEHLHLLPDLSMRHYVRAYELKTSGLDWAKVLLSDSIPEKARLIARLKADSRFEEERERVQEFKRLGGGGQTTWYKWAKRIQAPYDISDLKIQLCSGPPKREAA